MMDESDLYADLRPITLRNVCAASCGHEHKATDITPPVMVPEVGLVCANCARMNATEIQLAYPVKKQSLLPSF
jgi:hypothetical protein